MNELLAQFWNELVARLEGPLTFRVILQPSMALLYAIRDGIRDAREDRPAYFWAMLFHPRGALPRLRQAVAAVGQVMVLGAVMDVVYQFIVYRSFRPIELITVVLILVLVPYVLVRGPANRVARLWVTPGKDAGR